MITVGIATDFLAATAHDVSWYELEGLSSHDVCVPVSLAFEVQARLGPNFSGLFPWLKCFMDFN